MCFEAEFWVCFQAAFEFVSSLFCLFSGCLWLCGELSEECVEHPHCLHAVHVHLCCGGCAALQRPFLLLYRWIQGVWAWLQVRQKHTQTHWRTDILACYSKSILLLGANILSMKKITKCGRRSGNGRNTISTTTTCSGPFSPSSPFLRERGGHSM